MGTTRCLCHIKAYTKTKTKQLLVYFFKQIHLCLFKFQTAFIKLFFFHGKMANKNLHNIQLEMGGGSSCKGRGSTIGNLTFVLIDNPEERLALWSL